MNAFPELSVAVRNYAEPPPSDWRHVLDQARAADDAGISKVLVSDHVLLGSDLSSYGDPSRGGVVGGVQPTGPDGEWLEALTTVAAMVAVTTRVRFATNVLVAPLRRAVVLAKVSSTIDALSHGRFELGVGIGWQEAEYRAVGVPFQERGRVLDEALSTMRLLWTSEEATLTRGDVVLEQVHMQPKPSDPRGVPIWIGGSPIPPVARRLAEHGVGWVPWGIQPTELEDAMQRMRGLVRAAGGDFDDLRVTANVATRTVDGTLALSEMFENVPRLCELGVTDFRVRVHLPDDYEACLTMLRQVRHAFDEAVDRASP